MIMDLSMRVAWRVPIDASALGPKTGNIADTNFPLSPGTGVDLTTYAIDLVCPASNIPLSSSLPDKTVSASSSNKVGDQSDIERNNDDGEMFEAGIALRTNELINAMEVVLPQRFCGDKNHRSGQTKNELYT